jgi:F-type H+-transporting ATPase subunit delta
MAELATIARPYAEALFESAGASAATLLDPLQSLASVAADPQLRQFADNPKIAPAQVQDLVQGVVGSLPPSLKNLLSLILENGRLAVLPEIATQFRALVNAQSGVSDAHITSAFPIGDAQLADLMKTLERRFGRKLKPTVEIDSSLIGGVRVAVGDEVLDTSVRARLEHMRAVVMH